MFNIGPSNLSQLFSRFGGQNATSPMMGGGDVNMGNMNSIWNPQAKMGGEMPIASQAPMMGQAPIGPSAGFKMPPMWGRDADFRSQMMGYNMGQRGANPSQGNAPTNALVPSFTRRMGAGRRRR